MKRSLTQLLQLHNSQLVGSLRQLRRPSRRQPCNLRRRRRNSLAAPLTWETWGGASWTPRLLLRQQPENNKLHQRQLQIQTMPTSMIYEDPNSWLGGLWATPPVRTNIHEPTRGYQECIWIIFSFEFIVKYGREALNRRTVSRRDTV